MKTIDFAKSLKEFYTAQRTAQEVIVPTGTFLAVEQQGKPGGDEFQHSIQCLFAVVYTAKFGLKGEIDFDFKVSKLECVYLSDPSTTPMDEWRWRLLIRIPDQFTAANLATVKKAVRVKKDLDVSIVKRLRWNEGRAVQVLHVGPYERLGETYCMLHGEAAKRGLVIADNA